MTVSKRVNKDVPVDVTDDNPWRTAMSDLHRYCLWTPFAALIIGLLLPWLLLR